MTSELRQKLAPAFPMQEDGQQEFQEQTGINIETDIDRVVAALVPMERADRPDAGVGMVLARGRFDEVKIEALMREHGAQVEDYNGRAPGRRRRHAGPRGFAGVSRAGPGCGGHERTAFAAPWT